MASQISNYGYHVEDLIYKNRIEEQMLLEFRDWLDTQDLPNFPNETLALFLIESKNNINLAKQRITMYYNCRKNGPEIFNNRDITSDEMEFTLRVLDYVIVPRRTDENNVVIINRLHNFNAKNYNFSLAIKILFMVVDAAMYDDPPNGVIAVYDMHGTSMGHFFKASFSTIKKFINYTQDGFPIYIHAVHFLNITWFIGKILSVVQPLMKKQGPTHYHKSDINMEEFYINYIPRQCLPSDYGGSQDSMEELHELTVQKLYEMQQFFADEQNMREVFENENFGNVDNNDDLEDSNQGNDLEDSNQGNDDLEDSNQDTIEDDSNFTISEGDISTTDVAQNKGTTSKR